MKNFKHFLIITVAFAVSVTSCSNDDDDNDQHEYHLEYANVISAELPETFSFGNTYEINATIALPNSCYFYYDQFDYIYKGTARLIYPIVHVDDDTPCLQTITETIISIPVKVSQSEPYIFKFYQGKDEDGEDQFLIIEVPVI